MPALPLIDGWEWRFEASTTKWSLQQTHGTVADLVARLTASERPLLRNSVSIRASNASASPPASPAFSQSIPVVRAGSAAIPAPPAQQSPPPPYQIASTNSGQRPVTGQHINLPPGAPRPLAVVPQYVAGQSQGQMRPEAQQPAELPRPNVALQGQLPPLGSQIRPPILGPGQHLPAGAQMRPNVIPQQYNAQGQPLVHTQPQTVPLGPGRPTVTGGQPVQRLSAAPALGGPQLFNPARQPPQPVYPKELDTARSPSELHSIPAPFRAPLVQRRPIVATQPMTHPQTPQEMSSQQFRGSHEAQPPAELPAFSEEPQPLLVTDLVTTSVKASPAIPTTATAASVGDAASQRATSPAPSHVSRHSFIAAPVPDHITTSQTEETLGHPAPPRSVHSPAPSIASLQPASSLSRNVSTTASQTAETSSIHSTAVAIAAVPVGFPNDDASLGPATEGVEPLATQTQEINATASQLTVSTQTAANVPHPRSIVSPLQPAEGSYAQIPRPAIARVPVRSSRQPARNSVGTSSVQDAGQPVASPVSPESLSSPPTAQSTSLPSSPPVSYAPSPTNPPSAGSVQAQHVVSTLVPPAGVMLPGQLAPQAIPPAQMPYQDQPMYYNINGQIIAAHQIMPMPQGYQPAQTVQPVAPPQSPQPTEMYPPLTYVHTTPVIPTVAADVVAVAPTVDATSVPPPLAHTVSAPQVLQTTASGLSSAKKKASSWLSKRGAAANKWVAEHPIAAGAGAVAIEIGGLVAGVDAIKDYRTISGSINKAKLAPKKNQQAIALSSAVVPGASGATDFVSQDTLITPESVQSSQMGGVGVPSRDISQPASTVTDNVPPSVPHLVGQVAAGITQASHVTSGPSGSAPQTIGQIPSATTTAAPNVGAYSAHSVPHIMSGQSAAPSAASLHATVSTHPAVASPGVARPPGQRPPGAPGSVSPVANPKPTATPAIPPNIAMMMDSVSGLGRVAQDFQGVHGFHHHQQHPQQQHSQHEGQDDTSQEQQQQQAYQQLLANQQQLQLQMQQNQQHNSGVQTVQQYQQYQQQQYPQQQHQQEYLPQLYAQPQYIVQLPNGQYYVQQGYPSTQPMALSAFVDPTVAIDPSTLTQVLQYTLPDSEPGAPSPDQLDASATYADPSASTELILGAQNADVDEAVAGDGDLTAADAVESASIGVASDSYSIVDDC